MEFLKIKNRSNFIIKEIPTYNPASRKYFNFWVEQKTRAINGFWSIDDASVDIDITPEKPDFPEDNSNWRYIPPIAYFYCNFGTILANKKGASSGAKVPMRPSLDDVEWEFNYNWIEARGFSGFENDEEFSCNRKLLEGYSDDELINMCLDENGDIIKHLYNNYFKKNKTRKTFVACREYVRRLFPKNMGNPVYGNDPKNMMILATRDKLNTVS